MADNKRILSNLQIMRAGISARSFMIAQGGILTNDSCCSAAPSRVWRRWKSGPLGPRKII